jgi:hypothetical protein
MPRCDIDDTPLAQGVDTDLLDAGAHRPHRSPIARLQSVLNGTQCETGAPTSLVREVPEVFQARPTNLNGFAIIPMLYKYLYILPAQKR